MLVNGIVVGDRTVVDRIQTAWATMWKVNLISVHRNTG